MEVFASKTTIYAGHGSASALKELNSQRLFVVTDPYFMKNGIAETIAKKSGAKEFSYVVDAKTGELICDTCSCMMCKRQVINAGISTVVIRDDKENFRVIDVNDLIENDDSLSGVFGY